MKSVTIALSADPSKVFPSAFTLPDLMPVVSSFSLSANAKGGFSTLENTQPIIRLGDLLVEAQAVTARQLESALEEQAQTGMRLGEILIKNGWLTERELAEALSHQLRIPLVSLSRYRPQPEAVRVLPESVARRLEVIPLSLTDGGRLKVAMADPLNLIALDELKMTTSRDIDVGVAVPSEIRRELERAYSMQDSFEDALVEVVQSGGGLIEMDLASAGADADDAPVIKIVNDVLEQAVREGASDVHIEPFERNSQVRYRVDGQLFNVVDFPRSLHPAVVSRVKIMADMDISERRKPQDGRILIKVLDRRVDLRVSSLPTVYGEKIVFRILDQVNAKVGLEKIGFSVDDRSLIDDILSVPYGIILVTGPTGSGKSTTLYSMLEKINRPEVNIVTVEDPVEYTIGGITQVQVNEKAGLTFSSALRSILRQDPDKIMVGEIRDTETAQLAIRAALTGHLVFSTLHTNDAPSSAIRLIDMGVPPFLVGSSLTALVAQRLLRRLCPNCRQEYTIPEAVCRSLGLKGASQAWKPVGCDRCRGTGYLGRTGIFEILIVTEEMRRRISDEASGDELRHLALDSGMKTLRSAGIEKVLAGITSLEEVLAATFE